MTDYSGLVERLDDEISRPPTEPIAPDFYLGVIELCADAIKRLTAELAEAREMMAPFGESGAIYRPITLEQIRIAAAWLERNK